MVNRGAARIMYFLAGGVQCIGHGGIVFLRKFCYGGCGGDRRCILDRGFVYGNVFAVCFRVKLCQSEREYSSASSSILDVNGNTQRKMLRYRLAIFRVWL